MKNKRKFPVQQSKKSFKKVVLDHVANTQEQVLSIKKNIRKEVEEAVEKEIGDKIHMINSALDGVIALKEMFIEKGFISREEFNQQMAKMRKKEEPKFKEHYIDKTEGEDPVEPLPFPSEENLKMRKK